MGEKIKLEPCPFCGKEVRMIWNCGYHMVRCENDECCFENTKKYNDEKQAANAWNTRK